jgi:hypothetical protein
MLTSYEAMFGSLTKEIATPRIKKDHHEIDTSDFLHDLGIKPYQSLIGT